jgi:hypothetical protein
VQAAAIFDGVKKSIERLAINAELSSRRKKGHGRVGGEEFRKASLAG